MENVRGVQEGCDCGTSYRKTQLVNAEDDVGAASRDLLNWQSVSRQPRIVLQHLTRVAVEASSAALRIEWNLQVAPHIQVNLRESCTSRG